LYRVNRKEMGYFCCEKAAFFKYFGRHLDLDFTFENFSGLCWSWTEFQKIRSGSGSKNMTVRSSLMQRFHQWIGFPCCTTETSGEGRSYARSCIRTSLLVGQGTAAVIVLLDKCCSFYCLTTTSEMCNQSSRR